MPRRCGAATVPADRARSPIGRHRVSRGWLDTTARHRRRCFPRHDSGLPRYLVVLSLPSRFKVISAGESGPVLRASSARGCAARFSSPCATPMKYSAHLSSEEARPVLLFVMLERAFSVLVRLLLLLLPPRASLSCILLLPVFSASSSSPYIHTHTHFVFFLLSFALSAPSFLK